ncbi:MAG: fatty acid desaturase [Hyphomicrobiaceae bacterium]|nr:fatty acid desaturase [Hyphomicrobiaceae bacterium]
MQLKADALSGFIICHVIAAFAFHPYFFSWSGVVLLAVGVNLFGVLGLNVGFHRLLTHRGFSCPLWFEHLLAILGTCSLEFSPALWVAVHRRHHHHSDDARDPHSPLKGFFWSHFGWLLMRTGDMKSKALIDRYAKDLMRDPLYAWLERRKRWIVVSFLVWGLIFLAGAGLGFAAGGTGADALQLGSSWLVWGGALRTIVVWHITWSVNSAAHVWGYQSYATGDQSRNNVLVGFMAAGEGWHNNHHADPTSARHGHRWWEFDFSFLLIRLLQAAGLVWNVALPSPALRRDG